VTFSGTAFYLAVLSPVSSLYHLAKTITKERVDQRIDSAQQKMNATFPKTSEPQGSQRLQRENALPEQKVVPRGGTKPDENNECISCNCPILSPTKSLEKGGISQFRCRKATESLGDPLVILQLQHRSVTLLRQNGPNSSQRCAPRKGGQPDLQVSVLVSSLTKP
jgi:hypothetical protein